MYYLKKFFINDFLINLLVKKKVEKIKYKKVQLINYIKLVDIYNISYF